MNTLMRIVLLGLTLLVGSVQAADPLVISSGTDRATPIAVVPFGWQGGSVLPEDMAEIIGNDLRNSGVFEPIPRQNMISLPTQAAEVIYRDWQALGAPVRAGRQHRAERRSPADSVWPVQRHHPAAGHDRQCRWWR